MPAATPDLLEINWSSTRSDWIKISTPASLHFTFWWWRKFPIRKATCNGSSALSTGKTHLHHQRADCTNFYHCSTYRYKPIYFIIQLRKCPVTQFSSQKLLYIKNYSWKDSQYYQYRQPSDFSEQSWTPGSCADGY